jgi:tRNA pseudouridine55 synthase
VTSQNVNDATMIGSVPIVGRDELEGLDTAAMLDPGAVLLVDKPQGWTSFDVVAKCRGIFRVKKVGHTGTLDPMATGLLALCFGKATKLVEQLQSDEKEYIGTLCFGATTPTDDADSEVSETYPFDHLTSDAIVAAARSFVGTSLQRPPMFSARKVAGQRLYKLARRGETVEIEPREITVKEFEITSIGIPYASFRIVCSKGTYIRAIARDLGTALGSGAHLTALRRTRSGSLHVERAATIEQIQASRPRSHDPLST